MQSVRLCRDKDLSQSYAAGLPLAGLGTVEEGRFVDGRWQAGRTLAGDDTEQGNGMSLRADTIFLYKYR
jgi:hypothetical protein